MKDAATFPFCRAKGAHVTAALPRPQGKPLRRMMGALTAGITALSLLLAGTVQAQADTRSDNVAKAVIAAIAIGAILNSADKGRARPAPVPQHPVRGPSLRIPAACAIEISGKRRDVTVYPERCLRREGFDGRLPRQCANDARVFGRMDRVYGEDCLRDAGYRVGGRSDDRWRDDRHPSLRRGHDGDRWREDDWRRDDYGRRY